MDLIKKITFFCFFFIYPWVAKGQIGLAIGENGGEEATAIIQADDWLIVGGTFRQTLGNETSRGGGDIWLQKYDTTGLLDWQYTIGSPTNDVLQGLALFANDDFCVLGEYIDSLHLMTDTVLYHHAKAAFVSYHHNDGQLVWAKKIQAKGLISVKDIQADNDNNIYITGAFRDTFHVDTFSLVAMGNDAVFVLKINKNGAVIWAAQSQYATNAHGKSLAIDQSTKKVYLAGNFINQLAVVGDTITGDLSTTDIFLAALDSSGNWLWQRHYGGSYDEEVSKLIYFDNNLYMGGEFVGNLQIDQFTLATAFFHFDCFVAKLDRQGSSCWARQSKADADCFLESLAVRDTQIVAVGYFKDSLQWQNSLKIASNGTDIFQLLLDTSGQHFHLKTWQGNGNDLAKDVAISSHSKIMMVGSFQQDINLVNTNWNALGFSDAFFLIESAIQLPNGVGIIPPSLFKIYPNPSYDYLIIESPLGVISWELIAIDGRLVLQGKDTFLSLNSIGTGVYLLRIKTAKGSYIHKITKYQ